MYIFKYFTNPYSPHHLASFFFYPQRQNLVRKYNSPHCWLKMNPLLTGNVAHVSMGARLESKNKTELSKLS